MLCYPCRKRCLWIYIYSRTSPCHWPKHAQLYWPKMSWRQNFQCAEQEILEGLEWYWTPAATSFDTFNLTCVRIFIGWEMQLFGEATGWSRGKVKTSRGCTQGFGQESRKQFWPPRTGGYELWKWSAATQLSTTRSVLIGNCASHNACSQTSISHFVLALKS